MLSESDILSKKKEVFSSWGKKRKGRRRRRERSCYQFKEEVS